MNYYDILLAKKLEDDRDPRVEGLSVTANGRYEEDGVVYKPVIVSVQPPANSYQLKSMTTPTSLATFEASAMPMPSLKVSVEAKQASGTPSPSNPLLISGWDAANVSDVGKNLLNISDFEIGTLNSESGIEQEDARRIRSPFIRVKQGDYTVSCGNGNIVVDVYDTNQDYIRNESYYSWSSGSERTITILGDRYIRILFKKLDNSVFSSINEITNAQCEVGQTATSYEPYNGVTTTISLGQTVYGGELDVVNGGGKSKMSIIDLGDMNWTYQSANSRFVASDIQSVSKYPSSNDVPSNIMCSCYANNSYRDYTDGQIAQSNTGNVFIKDSNYTDAATFTTAVRGQKLVYELATPTTFVTQPTPIKSLNGINNLSVDCGEIIEGEYFKAL